MTGEGRTLSPYTLREGLADLDYALRQTMLRGGFRDWDTVAGDLFAALAERGVTLTRVSAPARVRSTQPDENTDSEQVAP